MATPDNREHLRAEYAYCCIEAIKNIKDPDLEKKYRTQVFSLPTRLHVVGLMQTIAFNCSKMNDTGKRHFVKLNLHLLHWILKNPENCDGDATAAYELFSQKLLPRLGTEQLMLYTREAVAFSVWLKRFAEARLEVPEEESDGDH